MYKDERILQMTAAQLQNGRIPVDVLPDTEAVFHHLAEAMAAVIRENNALGRSTVMIVPFGPVGQYDQLAKLVNEEALSLKNTTFINMDEYMWDETCVIEPEHVLSFRGGMDRAFYAKVNPALVMPKEKRLFPLPSAFAQIREILGMHGGADLCIGGIGINGHVAFNEAESDADAEVYALRPARVVPIAAETIVVNGINEYGGAYEFMPRWAATLGFSEICASKRIVLACFRPWHKMVVRKAVSYPPSTEFPVTLLAGHNTRILIPKNLL